MQPDEVIPKQGFEQTEQDHLPSKQKKGDRPKRQPQPYYKIPQAKPLLSKIIIDHRKPKILIRGLKIDLMYPQLLSASLSTPSITYEKQPRHEALTGQSSIWKRYISSGAYKLHYMKYQSTKLEEGERKGKRLRAEFQRNSYGNEWLIATHVIDMSFLSQTTSIMARNLASTKLAQEHNRLSQSKDEIVFDSAYQNGNLMFVFSKADVDNPREFSLVLQNDVNTKGYANWFNFKMFSAKPGPLRFHLVNLQKVFSYFSQGMKPVVYSLKDGKGWKMEGYNVSYNRNDLLKAQNNPDKYSILSFTIDQKHAHDTLVIAASIPYSYSQLLSFLDEFQSKVKKKSNIYYRRQSIAKTITGNDCPLITLTSKRDRKEDIGRKKIVVVIARQHPSEVVSSFVAQGVLSGLLNGKNQSEELLKKYIFKIVPMVNIDGVVYGNSRCDISGSDINRKWTRHSNAALFPIVSAIRKLVNQLIYEGYEVQYFLDLHGHSRRLGSFMYCCKNIDDIESRILAWLMSKITDKFVYNQCRFGVSMFRRETARGYFGMLLQNRKAITLQTSFFGYKTPTGFKPFTPKQLRQLGESLLMTLHADTFRTNGIVNWASVRNQIRQEMTRKKLQESQSQGSDSDPEGDQLSAQQKATTFLPNKVASKIGLVEVKVVQKPKRHNYKSSLKDLHSPSPQFIRRQEEEAKNSLLNESKRDVISSLTSPHLHQMMASQSLPKNQTTNDFRKGLRQTRSVTKIQPFKFNSQNRKSPGKRLRIAIDVQRLQSKETKLSAPSLPQVRVRNRKQFWHQLQNEYQALLTEKKALVRQAKEQVKLRVRD